MGVESTQNLSREQYIGTQQELKTHKTFIPLKNLLYYSIGDLTPHPLQKGKLKNKL
jgi:hypothetical protein